MKKIKFLLLLFSLFILSEETQAACLYPDMQTLTFNNNGTATMVVDIPTGADYYQVGYRKVGTGNPWLYMAEANNILTLLLLEPNETYDYRVRVRCNGVWQSFGGATIHQFNVPANNGLMSCTYPSETVIVNPDLSVTLSWASVPDANRYYLSYLKPYKTKKGKVV